MNPWKQRQPSAKKMPADRKNLAPRLKKRMKRSKLTIAFVMVLFTFILICNHVSAVEIFDMVYQEVVQDKLDVLLEDEYTFEDPLMIYNPYGTNTLGLNIYFSKIHLAKFLQFFL